MTGLDQDLMQKNLSCRNIKDAKKNMFWFSLTLVTVNLLFLSLGALLYTYAASVNLALPVADNLFPSIATSAVMPAVLSMIFVMCYMNYGFQVGLIHS
jgi:solute:Na+ symporter, SSS family